MLTCSIAHKAVAVSKVPAHCCMWGCSSEAPLLPWDSGSTTISSSFSRCTSPTGSAGVFPAARLASYCATCQGSGFAACARSCACDRHRGIITALTCCLVLHSTCILRPAIPSPWHLKGSPAQMCMLSWHCTTEQTSNIGSSSICCSHVRCIALTCICHVHICCELHQICCQ